MNDDFINVSIIYFLEYNLFTDRAMRILILFCLIFILSNCSTVEVAKEVTKASKSIGTSVNNIINNSKNNDVNKSQDTKVNDKKYFFSFID